MCLMSAHSQLSSRMSRSQKVVGGYDNRRCSRQTLHTFFRTMNSFIIIPNN